MRNTRLALHRVLAEALLEAAVQAAVARLAVVADVAGLAFGALGRATPATVDVGFGEVPNAVLTRWWRRWDQAIEVFDHTVLRTFRRRIFDAIPESYLVRDGEWLDACPDHALMTPALELAGGRHRMIDETLLIYTSDRPDAEWRVDGARINHHMGWVLKRPPLQPLPPLEAT